MVEPSRVHAAPAIARVAVGVDAVFFATLLQPPDVPEHLVRVTFRCLEAIGPAVPEISVVPAEAGTCLFQMRDHICERFRTVGTPPEMTERRRLTFRQLERVVKVVAPGTQVDGRGVTAGFVEAGDFSKEPNRRVHVGADDFDVGQL